MLNSVRYIAARGRNNEWHNAIQSTRGGLTSRRMDEGNQAACPIPGNCGIGWGDFEAAENLHATRTLPKPALRRRVYGPGSLKKLIEFRLASLLRSGMTLWNAPVTFGP